MDYSLFAKAPQVIIQNPTMNQPSVILSVNKCLACGGKLITTQEIDGPFTRCIACGREVGLKGGKRLTSRR